MEPVSVRPPPDEVAMNGHAHKQVGGPTGAVAAFALARKQTPAARIVETFGGYVGGVVGARLPDIIDPPTCPHHRSIGHGIVPVGLASRACLDRIPAWQEQLRRSAEEHSVAAAQTTDVWERLLHSLLELLCRVGAGMLAGIPAGYLSHLALDATTPAGLPLIAGRDARLDI